MGTQSLRLSLWLYIHSQLVLHPTTNPWVECVAKVWPRPFHCGSIYLGFSTHGVYYSTVVHPYTPQMAILFYMGKMMINNDQTSNLEGFPLNFPTNPPPYDKVCSCKGLPDSCSNGCNSWSQQRAWNLGDAAIDPLGPKNTNETLENAGFWRFNRWETPFFFRSIQISRCSSCSQLPWCIPGRDSEDKLPPIEVQFRKEVWLGWNCQARWILMREANQQSLGWITQCLGNPLWWRSSTWLGVPSLVITRGWQGYKLI